MRKVILSLVLGLALCLPLLPTQAEAYWHHEVVRSRHAEVCAPAVVVPRVVVTPECRPCTPAAAVVPAPSGGPVIYNFYPGDFCHPDGHWDVQ